MKIRTITAGFHLELPLDEERLRHIARFANSAKKELEQNGYAVQALRMATQPWEEYCTSKAQIVTLVKELEAYAATYAIDYYNVGPTKNPRLIPLVYDLISNTSRLFCTVPIADERRIDYEAARQTAALIKGLSTISPDGFSNLRFAGPGWIPFRCRGMSAKLMPVPHKKVGEMTDYKFEYFANTRIMNI